MKDKIKESLATELIFRELAELNKRVKYSDDVNDITVALQRIKELEKTLNKLNNL